MKTSLEGTVALVTGASSGIGEATARRLAAEGASVAVAARGKDRLDALVDEITSSGGRALALETDVTVQAQAEAAVEATVAEFGRLDTVINNAGVMLLGPIEDAPLEEWDRMVALNVQGLPAVPGPLGDIELSGVYVGNVEIGATEAAGAASIFGPDDAGGGTDSGGGGAVDLSTDGGFVPTDGGGLDLGPTQPSLPTVTSAPPRDRVEPAAAVDLFDGRLELLYAAFALAVLGLCIAPRLTVPSRLPGPAA